MNRDFLMKHFLQSAFEQSISAAEQSISEISEERRIKIMDRIKKGRFTELVTKFLNEHDDESAPATPGALQETQAAAVELSEIAFDGTWVQGGLSPETVVSIAKKQAMLMETTSLMAMCQSSGYGKSRLAKEVCMRHYAFYISFNVGRTQYPPATPTAEALLGHLRLAERAGEAAAWGRGFINSMLDACVETAKRSPADWFKFHTSSDFRPLFEPATVDDLKVNIELFKEETKEEAAIFFIDEAAPLLEESQKIKGMTLFRLLRRAFAVQGVTAVFASTNSRVQNFAPAVHRESSLRLVQDIDDEVEGSILPRPLVAVGPIDMDRSVFSRPMTARETTEAVVMGRFGRPLWSAYLEAYKARSTRDVGTAKVNLELERYATMKLGVESPERWLAVAMCLARFKIVSTSQLAETIVASHMATLCFVEDNRELLHTCYPSEPLLAAAAMRVFESYPEKAIHAAAAAIERGVGDAGLVGELATRFLALLASDSSGLVRLGAFTERLVGSSIDFGDAWFNFNHFSVLEGSISPESLALVFRRRMAVIPQAANHKAVDMYIPLFFGCPGEQLATRKMGCLAVQVKNRIDGLDSKLIAESIIEKVTKSERIPTTQLVVLVVQRNLRQKEKKLQSQWTTIRRVPVAVVTFSALLSKVPEECAVALRRLLGSTGLKYSTLADLHPSNSDAMNQFNRTHESFLKRSLAFNPMDELQKKRKRNLEEKVEQKKLRLVGDGR